MDDPQRVHALLGIDMYRTDIDIEKIHDRCDYYTLPSDLPAQQGFSVLHVNARSLKNKMDTFLNFLSCSGVEWSAICVSETWLKNDVLSYFSIDNYDLFASCRESNDGGGTAVYVNRKFCAKVRNDLNVSNNESTFVEVQVRHGMVVKNIVVSAICRCPSSSHTSFMDSLEIVLQKLMEEKKFVILTGDFNYNLIKENDDKNTQDFCNLMSSYGYTNVISKPTRITRDHASLLDNIFISDEIFFNTSGIIMEDLSDHLPIFINLSFTHEHVQRCQKQTFDMKKNSRT